jgi:hypothetical protein
MGLVRHCVVDLTRAWRKVDLEKYDDAVIASKVGNVLE